MTLCPGCSANGMFDDCYHEERAWMLADAMAKGLPGGPAEWGTEVDRAWAFADDAQNLIGDVGEPPYRVSMFHPEGKGRYTTVGVINGRYLFAVDEEVEFIGDVCDPDGRNVLMGILSAHRVEEEN